MTEHILEIIVMLLGAAILGFFIGWFLRKAKIEKLESYIRALEEKNNRLQADLNGNEKLLIDCQTEKKKLESGDQKPLMTAQKSTVKVEKPKNKQTESTKPKKKPAAKTKPDNLTKIEGIGPKLASLLKAEGIDTFVKLSEENPGKISEILVKAGGNSYKRFDPQTWPDQAKLAAEGKWEELKVWQDELKGGRK